MKTFVDYIHAKKKRLNDLLQKKVQRFQKNCSHPKVGHWDGFSEYSTMYPHRICLRCGYEEEGGWWCYSIDCSHWHNKDSNEKTVLGPKQGREFVKMSFDEIMKFRP